MITWGLIPGFYTMGISTGNSALVSAAFALTNPWVDLGVGLVFFALSLPIALVKTRSLVRTFQYPVTIIMFISMFVIVWILAGASRPQLDMALSKYLASNVTSIMSSARTSYPVAMMPPTFALIPLLAATAFTAGSFNTYWSAWASGEVKRGSQVTMQILTMILPAVIIILFVGSSIFVAQATLGRDFLVALTQTLSLNPGFFSSAPPMPSYIMTLLPMILADNPTVQFVIMLGIICAVLAYLPATWLVTSRQWFAWSFDRLIPSKFSEVSDRFHTPIWSVVANFLAGLIFLVIFTFFIQYLGFFTTASWDISFVPIALVNIAGIVIPLRKNLWSLSPANKYSIGGVPLISVFGLVGLFFNGAAMVVYTVTPILGYGLPSTTLILISFVVPFVLYWVIRYIRKAQGIDLGIVFSSVPPE
jgi:amino acid transporter